MGHQDPPTAHAAWCFLLLVWLANSALGHGDTALQPHGGYWWPRGGRPARSYPHLQGDARRRRLYSSTHYFLRIGGEGNVDGTRRVECPDNIVEIRSVRAGIVAIRSVHSGFYLAMNRKGKLYGTKAYTPSCNFVERIEENGYNTYASLLWHHEGRPMFLSLNAKGVPRKGPKTRRQHLSAHFLPMLVS
ncbi:fibroblast growth factor 22 [Podarcis lilfordi]|uniref:Fibroblast growth factor n=1 Tax=Podarcis lilfordi TaxID=74358 RepID=A0AA35PV40_9SAUR|nr:fibroblast growth factor 22 [Podarcis lilfordi]